LNSSLQYSTALDQQPTNPPAQALELFGWNYKPAEKYGWLIFYERKILFRLKKQTE
jgi:hypothetical protein